MSQLQRYISTCLLATAALVIGASAAFAANSVSVGAVTCANSVISRDVGSSGAPASVTQTNCTPRGAVVAPVSAGGLTGFNRAYDKYANISCTGSLNTEYAGTALTLTLTPGVYCNAAGVTFTDTALTLDAQGDPNAVWIFKIGTGGTGALNGTNFSVVMANGGQPCNVYWWVADAVTMTTPDFQGTIVAGAAITMTGVGGGARAFNGNALAKAAVKLTDIAVTGCGAAVGGGNSRSKCNQGVGNDPEVCDPANSDAHWPFGRSNDEVGGVPGSPGRKGGKK